MAESQKVTVSISTMSLVRIVVVALFLFLLFWIRDIILTLIIAMVLASAMDPLVEWLYRRARFPRGLSVILVYLVFLGLFAAIFYFLIPPILTEFKSLGTRLDSVKHDLAVRTSSLGAILDQLGVTSGISALGQGFANYTDNIFKTTIGVFNGFVQAITVMAVTFYLISSENGMKNLVRSLAPFKHKAYAVSLTDKVQKKIAHWLLGQLILSGVIFLLTFVGLQILGVRYALALALLAGLLEIVPYLGPVLSAVPAVFIAFVQSPPLAVFVLVLYIIVQQLENYVLVPKVMGRSVGANPLVILLAVLIGFKLLGIMGVLLSVPVVAALGVFFSDLREMKERSS